ncbi:hypothetical protein DF186_21310, partial [Enterococcus hirae]
LLHQTTQIHLHIQQTISLQKTPYNHQIKKQQIKTLHNNQPIKINIHPNIQQITNKKNTNKQHNQQLTKQTPIQTTQLLPTPD